MNDLDSDHVTDNITDHIADNLLENDPFADDLDEPAAPSSGTDQPIRNSVFFEQIPVMVSLEVASIELPLGELMQVSDGSVIPLDKEVGEPLDVKVNGKLLAKGEVVVENGKYGLRIISVEDAPLTELG
jgi:flagellar motor switch protein FliN